MAVNALTAAAVAAVTTLLATPVLARVAVRTGVVDVPGHLKPHADATPYLGGVAVFAGLVTGVVLDAGPIGALLPLAAALLLGLVDDIRALPVLPRLVAEVGIGVLVALELEVTGWSTVAAAVIGTVAVLNAVNFVDGTDGLATGVTVVSCAAATFLLPGTWSVLAACIAAASAAFLVFNKPPARIYLGDAGSYLLGTATAICLIALAQDAPPGTPTMSVLGTLLGFAMLPVVEMSSTVSRRLLARRPLFEGDRAHLYDRLGRALPGWCLLAVLLTAHGLAVASAVIAQRVGGAVPGVLVGAAVATTAALVTASAMRSGAPGAGAT